MIRRTTLAVLLLLGVRTVLAQYPLTRVFELRAGLQRPHIAMLAQDDQGLLWAASDQGLLRSDGERTDLVWPSGNDVITALHCNGADLFAVTASGLVLHTSGYHSDTLWTDTAFAEAPARAIQRAADGTLWIGTYGRGLLLHNAAGDKRITTIQGLGDDHVNALCPVGRGRMAVATDQGISICDATGRVLARIGEEQGAPDNLVLSLAPAEDNGFWAGTHHSGVFRFDPDAVGSGIQVLDSTWDRGAVRALAASGGSVWAGSGRNGVMVLDIRQGLGSYELTHAAEGPLSRITGMMRAKDGAVWWCDGSEQVVRADPDVLVVPEHEGVDLKHITALCADPQGHLWFATGKGVFRHDAVFADRSRLSRAAVPVDPERPVVALRVDAEGTLWAGTFGQGVYRIRPDGHVQHFGLADGLCNDNVLAIRVRDGVNGPETWFATLGGVCVFRPEQEGKEGGGFRTVAITGSGFVYDVLPMDDGSTLVATDGNGIIRVDGKGATELAVPGTPATYYSLCPDGAGGAWACGPGIGLCHVQGSSVTCNFKDRPPFDGDVFAIAFHAGHVLTLGKTGLASLDPRTMRLLDLGEELGLEGVEAELNTICTDAHGALWLACDRGLVRLTPTVTALDAEIVPQLTGLYWGDQPLPLIDMLSLRYDQNFLTFRFAAPHYAAPGQVHFVYRLVGFDGTVRTTRDREVTWSRLPPGEYRFELKALLGDDPGDGRWTSFSFTIAAPWWRTPWAIGAAILLLTIAFYVFIRTREERMRYRDRVERERTQFQLEALRSQVNPHFLFNSFNTLIDLIEQDHGKAIEHVEHLSDFFREILGVRDRTSIPLAEEMDLVRTYFYLEQRRFGDRVAMKVDIPEAEAAMHVPPLAVQLLVENALKHNAATTEEPLLVEVTSADGWLEVRNAFRPRAEAPRSTGFGVQSIRRHYAALTDQPVSVVNEGGWFIVRIPLLTPP